jgi:hypothetical protein
MIQVLTIDHRMEFRAPTFLGIFQTLPAARFERASNAFLLILWSGGTSYVRPIFGGMAASGSVPWSTPLAKML